MTTDQAKQLVERLRRRAHGRSLPGSDLALLRSLCAVGENVSFMLTAMWGLVMAMDRGWSWSDLGLAVAVPFVVYLRWDMHRLREAIHLLDEGGAEKVGVSSPMRRQDISPDNILRLAVGCIVLSALAALAFLVGRQYSFMRGPSAGVGIMAAFFGSGVAAWFSIRARNLKFCLAALLSLLPLAFWAWVIYERVHV